MFSRIPLRRLYSTVQPKRTPSYKVLLQIPVFKSLFLTLVFGTTVVEATKNRKEIEALRAAYEAKFAILRDVTAKLNNKEPVDVAQELRIANAMTKNKYNSVTDVELDEQFEDFLKMAETDFEMEAEQIQPVKSTTSTASTAKSTQFL